MTLRVLLVDDQAMVRQGFRMVLSVEPGIDVVGEASDGAEAIARTRELQPDVVVMDVQMPGIDGIEATRAICVVGDARVLILTTFDRDDYVFDALDAGASGFLLKNAEPERLVEAIEAVGHGHALLSPEVTARVIARMATPAAPEPTSIVAQLTARERDVLLLVAQGMSNAEIAAALFVGEATVKTHVSNVLTKFGLRDRVQAVRLAYECGLVRPAG